jgi:hypothetical protein
MLVSTVGGHATDDAMANLPLRCATCLSGGVGQLKQRLVCSLFFVVRPGVLSRGAGGALADQVQAVFAHEYVRAGEI